MHEHQFDHGKFRDPRSVYEGWGRGHGGREQRFGPHGHRHGGFDGPRPGDMANEERADFADTAEEGDDTMFGNSRDWRGGGPRGRDRHGFGFGRGPDRPERPLEQGDLRWLVLDLIALQPRHGYEIIKAIEEMLNGHYTPSPGVIYPTLTFLEETGLIASEAQATKKLYSLTNEGRAALEANAAAIQAIRARIEETRMRFGGPPAPEMHRAMENLRAAIQVRLAKGELSPESLAAVTAALDRAAGEIERS
jgi:DNA-binding PadR family transcriptional regulator